MTDYSELVGRLRSPQIRRQWIEQAADAIEALQAATGRWDDLLADRDHWKARAERAEAVVEAARVFYSHEGCMASTPKDLQRIRDAIDALDHQEGEQ